MKKMTAVLLLALALTLTSCGVFDTEPPPSSTTPAAAGTSTAPPPAEQPPGSSQAESTVPADAAVLTLTDYFPFNENVHRTYAGTGNEYAGYDSWIDYINDGALQIRKNNSGTEWVEVYIIEDDTLKRVFSLEEAYFRQDLTAERLDGEIVLMGPLEAGTTWTLQNGAQRSITAIAAGVTVPYGTFTALEVTTVYDASTVRDYYAPGIGLIKTEFVSGELPSEPITSELENYEEGSPLRQYAHFYYPDFNNSRVAYIEKTFDLMTNENITGIFEQEFKTVPEGSGLTPVMTEGAALNSISYDAGTRVVTADVSGTFITGMNAGAPLEGLILQSLANTLGWYFQTDMVRLTVDGGPYESGHFLFGAGDYLPFDLSGTVAYNP